MTKKKYNKLFISGVVLITLSVLLITFNIVVRETSIAMDIIAIILAFITPLLATVVSKEIWIKQTRSEQLRDFHRAFGYKSGKFPQPLSIEEVRVRNKFATEELVEAVFGTVRHDEEEFKKEMKLFINAVKEVTVETLEKNKNAPAPKSNFDVLVEQTDGFIDAKYFLEGTMDMMGIDTTPIFDIVHNANMNKLGKDGQPIIRESDGKIQKPKGWVAPEPLIERELKRQINNASIGDVIEK